MDYSYLFVTGNSERGKDIQQTSERGVNITELSSETDLRIYKIYIFDKDSMTNQQRKEEIFCARKLLSNLMKLDSLYSILK